MFWNHRSKKDAVEVRRAMARVINEEFSASSVLKQSPENDGRGESRSEIHVPVIIVEFSKDPDTQPNIKTGITQDLSCEGLGVITTGPLPIGDLIVGIGPFDHWAPLKCKSLRTQSIGYGYFKTGIHIEKVLPAKDFEPVMEYAKTLEETAAMEQHQLQELHA